MESYLSLSKRGSLFNNESENSRGGVVGEEIICLPRSQEKYWNLILLPVSSSFEPSWKWERRIRTPDPWGGGPLGSVQLQLYFIFIFFWGWAGTAASPCSPASQPLAHAVCCFSLDENINQRGVKSAIFLLSGSAAAVCECHTPSACLLLLSQQMQDVSLIAGYK